MAREVRVTDADGENLGVFPIEEALRMRTEGIDLIEVIPNATPPVTKLISFDKYRYLREKEEKRQRAAQRSAELKQVQISARAAEHDKLTKAKQLEKFLNEGHAVEIQMKLRGREKALKSWIDEQLQDFLKLISVEYKVVMPPRTGGRGIQMQIAKK